MSHLRYAFTSLAACAASVGAYAQSSLAENATAAGISVELARRATSSGSSTLARAKKSLAALPQAQRDPFAPPPPVAAAGTAGSPMFGPVAPGQATPEMAAPEPPAPAPWAWRLKGFVSRGRVLTAVWLSPDGTWRTVGVGDPIDDRAKVMSIRHDGVVVLVDGKKMGFSPW